MKHPTSRRRWLLAAGLAVAAFIVIVGPWPTYGPRDLQQWPEFQKATREIASSAGRSRIDEDPGPLRAGWASVAVQLPAGTPLAGYGLREGRPSEGSLDPIRVKALVLRDDADTVAILSGDLLIIPERVAARVRAALGAQIGLRPESVVFSATHTHSGPGAFAPGWLARQFAGRYDAGVEQALVGAFETAAVAAHERLRAARLGAGSVAAGDLIHNRTRPGAAEDAELQFLRIENDRDETCVIICFAAHATLLGPENMRQSGDYPGHLERALESNVDLALFLAGAVGSMGPEALATPDAADAAQAMGRALAKRVADRLSAAELFGNLEIASAAAAFEMPPLQARLTAGLRVSPILMGRLGLSRSAWIGGVRIGHHVLVGFPGDFSGEMSVGLKQNARTSDVDLWLLSFNGDYVGYISPDRYYSTALRSGKEGYEIWTMGWFGPQQGELLTRLAERVVAELMPTGPPHRPVEVGGRTLLH